MNLLTSAKRYKLRVDSADFNGNTAYAEYDNFVVQSSTDKYRLSSLGNYTGTAGTTGSRLRKSVVLIFHMSQSMINVKKKFNPCVVRPIISHLLKRVTFIKKSYFVVVTFTLH